MTTILGALIGIVIVGALYVVLPIVVGAYRKASGRWMVTCPATEDSADVELDATHAAITAALGESKLRVRTCSHWPELGGCEQECVR